MRPLILLVLALALLPLPALAIPTIGCHCFQDRTFDPQRPTAADDYFLASAQNSLFAALSGIAKREVVRDKMGGADGAELWVSWYLAQAGPVGRERVVAARGAGRSWRQITEELRIPPERLSPALLAELLRGETTARLATAVVDAALLDRCGVAASELQRLRAARADDQQTILALVLAHKTGRPAGEALAAAMLGSRSWSAQLSAAGITAGELEAAVTAMIR